MTRFAALCFALAFTLAHAELPAPIRAALAKANVPPEAVAVVVQPATGGKPVVAHNATTPMNPASVMKVVTSYAALDLLGPAFTFKTDVLITGTLAGGVLDGDLVLRGGGDPKLTAERLWQLVHVLRARGIREVRGDVILDRNYFGAIAHDPSKFDGDTRRAYNVGPDALLVNFQAVDFRFIPDGNGVKVVAQPDLPNLEVQSRLTPTKEACGSFRRGLKHEVDTNGLLVTILFTGTYPADCGEKVWSLSVFDGQRFTESVLRWIWSEAGGVIRGKVRAGTAPIEARLFHRHESEPLSAIVRDMNKHSNNVVARHLFLALSAERGQPGDPAASAAVAREWLKARGIQAPEVVFENGSGLSRDERASAATIAAVLSDAARSALWPELASSFPIYAVDGTFKNRRGAGATGHAHLKGGTLTGVQAIAGYVLDRKGERWTLVMLANHANANAAQPAMDALVEWTYEGRR